MGITRQQLAACIAAMGLVAPSNLPSGWNIILANGQSNMVGAGSSLDTDPIAADLVDDPLVRIWGTNQNMTGFHTIKGYLSNGNLLLTTAQAGISTTNPAYLFARLYAQMTGKKTLLVMTPYSATSLYQSHWEYTPTLTTPTYSNGIVAVARNTLYNNAVYEANLAVAAAIADTPGSAVVGSLWIQGENDAGFLVSCANYKAALEAVTDGFRANINTAANSWFVVGSMLPEGIYTEGMDPAIYGVNAGGRAIHRAHKLVCSSRARSAFARGSFGGADRVSDSLSGFAIHYRSRASRLDLATRMLNSAMTAANKTVIGTSPSAPDAPVIYSAVATSGQSVRLQLYRDFSKGNKGLVIQYKPSAGSTWTTYCDGTKATLQYAEQIPIGGLTASTPYDIRVADVNSAGTSAYSAVVSVTTLNTATGYTFEDDAVGNAPAGVTSYSRRAIVTAAPTVPLATNAPAYGKCITANTGDTHGSNTYDLWLDKIPLAQDRTVTFRLGKTQLASIVSIKAVMRAQPDSPSATGFIATARGYGVTFPQSAASAASIEDDVNTNLTTTTTYHGYTQDCLYRVRCTGVSPTNIVLSVSTNNGATWTDRATATDPADTFTEGGVQLVIQSVSTLAELFIDEITWS